jgi:hypothetical protein
LVLGTSPLTQKASLIDLAFDRLGWVRVVTHKSGTCYELVGIRRRRPATCTVSAATAAALVAAGLPTVVRSCEDCEAGAC